MTPLRPSQTRRSLLQALAALSLACSGDDGDASAANGAGGSAGKAGAGGAAGAGGNAGGPPSFASPFDVWRDMRQSLRTSPDHLAGQADALVAKKDLEAIVAFVRDRFGTVPLDSLSIGPAHQLACGVRGTLRYGAGSLRDKAELLVELCKRAGFDAKVVSAPPADDYVAKVLVRVVDRPFAPAPDGATVAAWGQALGWPAPEALTPFDPMNAEADALGDALADLLPGAGALGFAFDPPSEVPFVEIVTPAGKRWIDPSLPGATLSAVDPGASPAPPAVPAPAVNLKLSAVTARSPETPVELVSATFAAEAVVGRAVALCMAPVDQMPGLLLKDMKDVRSFLPTFAVRGPDMSESEQQSLTVSGAAITLMGEVQRIEDDGTVTVDGVPLDTSPVDPQKVAAVASLELVVLGDSYPDVRLRFAAYDGAGNPVNGLGAAAFQVEEDGQKQVFSLLSNLVAPPRIIFCVDQSGSMPPEFAGDAMGAVCRAIAEGVLASHGDASFAVHYIDGETRAFTTSPTQVEIDASKPGDFGQGSTLWEALVRAAEMAPTVIVMITDGEATDADPSKFKNAAAFAPPVLGVKVAVNGDGTLDEMAALTGGKVLPVSDGAGAKQATLDVIAKQEKSTYLLRYRAPSLGAKTRKVKVSLPKGTASAEGTYVVPDAPAVPPRVGGLLLSVQLGEGPVVTRVLAGVPKLTPDTPKAAFDAAEGAFFGAFELRFERATPTLSAFCDDKLAALLSWEPMWKAARSKKLGDIFDAFEAGRLPISPEALLLFGPLASSPTAPVLQHGLRCVVTTTTPDFATDLMRRGFDILPLGGYTAVTGDGAKAFRATLRSTARLALIERSFGSTSTASLLAGKDLAIAFPFAAASEATTIPPALAAAWGHIDAGYESFTRLVPVGGAPVACWAIDGTGTLLGVLQDQTGGTQRTAEMQKLFDQALGILNWASAVGGYFGFIGFWGGVWLSFEKAKLKLLALATIAIIDLEGFEGGMSLECKVQDIASGLVCDVLKGGAGELGGKLATHAAARGWANRYILPGAAGSAAAMADGFLEAGVGKSWDCGFGSACK